MAINEFGADFTTQGQSLWQRLHVSLGPGQGAGICQEERDDSFWGLLGERLKVSKYQPKVVQNIEWAEIKNSDNTTIYMLRNKNNNKYISMREKEVYICNLIDGKNTVENINLIFLDEYGFIGEKIILDLLHLLRVNGFLTEEPLTMEQILYGRLANRKPWAYIKAILRFFTHSTITTRRADAYFDKLYHYLGPLFFNRITYTFFSLALIVNIVLSFYYVFIRHESMLLVPGQAGTHDVIAMMAVAYISLAIHENAHGLTVKHYGRHISKGGFLILFGSPIAYVDTTDIWMKDRFARIAVSFAGPCINGVLAGVLLGISWFVSDSFLENLLIHAGLLNSLMFLVNLLPIIETDGHYIIQDWFELPRLRAESLAFMRKDLWVKLVTRQKWEKMDFIFLLYGTIAVAGLVLLFTMGVRLWYSTGRHLVEAIFYRPLMAAEILLFPSSLILVIAWLKRGIFARESRIDIFKNIEAGLQEYKSNTGAVPVEDRN